MPEATVAVALPELMSRPPKLTVGAAPVSVTVYVPGTPITAQTVAFGVEPVDQSDPVFQFPLVPLFHDAVEAKAIFVS